ncbi:MAG: hypothetical protein AVDCRST_MAG66-1899 [uncultured Pseudonocardia sp.]|uniref:GNAT family N-acetyltransferase n=1 Tax=uncultured Pseudonocardia sp. TaxID=211455 RepID=A0A6J4P851_9PSEU|nr:MAG: hypothetical protein AVDCRST_MAG66-1899 [uncultured Pseudonocardia sp.]
MTVRRAVPADVPAPAPAFYRSLGAVALDGWTTHRLDGSALAALGRS